MHHTRFEPASLGQERIWSLCQSHSHTPLYNFGFSTYLEGDFDVDVMQQTINIIVNRHEALRTTFSMVDGELKQVIKPELQIKQQVFHRKNVAVEDISDEIRRIAKSEIFRHFDLQDGPLVRNIMVKFSDDHCGWIVVLHHIISDGWSAGLLAYETNIIFRALATNKPYKLSDVPMQYVEYVNSEREAMNNEKFNQSLQYWGETLSGIKDIEMSKSHQLSDSSFSHFNYSFSKELLKKLNVLSKKYDTTLFNVLLIAFRIALWKRRGVKDTVITVPVVDRNNFKSHKTIGYFINLVPIRITIPDDFHKDSFIEQVINNVRESFLHADVPMEHLSQYLQLSESTAENPLYQTLFSLQNFPIPENIYNYKILEINNYSDVTEFDLNFRVTTFNHTGQIEVIYNPSVYQYEEIKQLLESYSSILETMDAVVS